MAHKFEIGQTVYTSIQGKRTKCEVYALVSDTDGFDGPGYALKLSPGLGTTLPESVVEGMTFADALTNLMTTPEGIATLREWARK